MTHYDRLGVDPEATQEQIRQAYLRLARQRHPDTQGATGADPAESNVNMAALNSAWFVLGDPDRRRTYDESMGVVEPPPFRQEPRAQPVGAWAGQWEPPPSPAEARAAVAMARLWAVVAISVSIMLSALFVYAFIKSGSVGQF